MSKSHKDLGPLVSVHGTSPVFLQRAAVIAVLAFVFFMATLLLFYMQQKVEYFALASAFLVLYLFTFVGWIMQKRNVVSIYEKGIAFRKFVSTWNELKSVTSSAASGITLVKASGESVTIGKSVANDQIAILLRQKLPTSS